MKKIIEAFKWALEYKPSDLVGGFLIILFGVLLVYFSAIIKPQSSDMQLQYVILISWP